MEILPNQGVGFEAVLEELEKVFLISYPLLQKDIWHIYIVLLLLSIASELIIASFNQSMDSWDQVPWLLKLNS